MTDRESIEYAKRIIKNSEKVIFAGQPANELRLYTTDKGLEMLKRVVELADRKPCSDAIDRQAVFNTLDNMDKALDVDRTVENYKQLLKECFENLTPVKPANKRMTIDEALYNIKQGYGIPHKHDTLTTIIEYVKKAESCKDMGRYDPYTDTFAKEDYISRQAAIKETLKYTMTSGVTNQGVWNECVQAIADTLANAECLPSVQPKVVPIAEIRFDDDKLHEIVDEAVKNIEIKPGWIPVSERLPEDMQPVLMTIRRMSKLYSHEPFITVGHISWNQKTWWCAHDGDCVLNKIEVVAWMPLPESYKESEDKE